MIQNFIIKNIKISVKSCIIKKKRIIIIIIKYETCSMKHLFRSMTSNSWVPNQFPYLPFNSFHSCLKTIGHY